jgi:DNA-binding MarR family transcriptional regulator
MAHQLALGLKSPDVLTEKAVLLRSALFIYGRCLLSVDDATLELPLRQLKVCISLTGVERSMSEIGQELDLSPSALTQVAVRLERRGLVERETQTSDRRVRLLKLTARGRKLMRQHQEKQLQRIVKALSSLSAQQVQEVERGFHILANACEGMASAPERE